MTSTRATDALRWFAESGGGSVRLFGGEPLLVPGVVRAAIDYVASEPRISMVTLCSNGILLDQPWFDYLESQPKAWLTVSLDGRPEDHLRSRPAATPRLDARTGLERIMPRLVKFPRVIVTQVVAPEIAERAADGFRYLLGLGFRRFNLMPASYVQWSSSQLDALKNSFAEIADVVKAEWRAGRPLYLRNLHVRNAFPTFATGTVVDVDGSIFPSDCILAGLPSAERELLYCGLISAPPGKQQLAERAAAVPGVLNRFWPAEIQRSTALADSVLDWLWHELIRDYLIYRLGDESQVCVGAAGPDASEVVSISA